MVVALYMITWVQHIVYVEIDVYAISIQYHAQKTFTLFSICVPRNLEELTV
jgi:hypothetical protein